MAQISTFLTLKADGQNVEGESSVFNMAGEDVSKMIECISYEEGVSVGYDSRTGSAQGDRTYDPIKIRKWVDKASPLIAQAAAESRKCEAEFKFFRPTGDGGGWEHYFTVAIEDARVQRIQRNMAEGGDSSPMKEDVYFVFSKIRWKHETASTEHQDDWRERNKK
jgi:type VI secretion system secreted protein Hcp